MSTQYSKLHEGFLQQPSQVDDILDFLAEMAKTNKMEGAKEAEGRKPVEISGGIIDSSFIVTHRSRMGTKRSKSTSKKPNFTANMNQMTFMRQIDVSDAVRKAAREERIRVATNFRRLGNAEYRKGNFDKAIDYYTRGLNYIVDSPVLFANRALCYIKKRGFKRALLDLDYVLNNIDGCCMRAWLYKAGTLKRLNDDNGYDECVENARRFNKTSWEYIDKFLDRMRSDF